MGEGELSLIVFVTRRPARAVPESHVAFCTGVHSFPQKNFAISLASKKDPVYGFTQIEPGSLKN